ncbi:MAG: OmpA family protein [Thermoanaerobaculia bacterium]|nr:OmpA family protein [Thermoanaerobaculia bacterium]
MPKLMTLALALPIALVASGCATKKYVRNENASTQEAIEEHVRALETQIEDNQGRLSDHDRALVKQGAEIARNSETANDALERAQAAGKLAEGKLLYEVILSSDEVSFELESAELRDSSRVALDDFAAQLKQADENVFIEIQGHTDSSGEESFNLVLGERRAESVRRYLSMEHGIPLHRMSVISYGESAPLVDNDSRENRARNRRVALVVLM